MSEIRPALFAALRRIVAIAFLLAAAVHLRGVDATWNYAVQVSATVLESPPTIALSWVEDTTPGLDGYRPAYSVSRRVAGEEAWGTPIAIPMGETRFIDSDVEPGIAYEYEVKRVFQDPQAPSVNHNAYGYLLSGIAVPLPDQRGKVILVVERAVADELGDRVERLRRDLIGDGWSVKQLTASAASSPGEVRDLIRGEYYSETTGARTVFLLGHVPVAFAGRYAPDGHERRAMPCDAYYGDMDGIWVDADGDGVFEGNVIASDIELEVGRVDFAGMEELGSGKSELELVAQYLDKNHAFRAGSLRFGRGAVIGDRVGVDRGRAPAASGYRAFSAFYGPENIVAANVEDVGPDEDRWISILERDTYAWAFGSGAGSYGMVAFLGTEGEYKFLSSATLAAQAKAGFYLFFGSYFVEWHQPNNLLRAALASPFGGLGAAWSGRPSLHLHHLGLGGTIGASVRLTQNNDGTNYFSPANAFRRAVHVAWMGDPTLRLEFPAPVTELAGVSQGGVTSLTWRQPSDQDERSLGYLVYKADSLEGSFVRLTPSPIAELSYVDTESGSGAVYLVRAVRLETTASGTYENAGQGAFWTDEAADAGVVALPQAKPISAAFGIPLLFTPPSEAQQPGPRLAPTP